MCGCFQFSYTSDCDRKEKECGAPPTVKTDHFRIDVDGRSGYTQTHEHNVLGGFRDRYV